MQSIVRTYQSLGVRFALECLCAIRHGLRRIADALVPAELVASEVATGALDAQVASCLANMGIASALISHGPLTTFSLASRLGLKEDKLDRVLSFSAARGLLSARRDGRFAANRLTHQLDTRQSANASHFTQYFNARGAHAAVAELGRVLEGDEQAYVFAHGQETWAYFKDHPAESRHFDGAMAALSERDAKEVVDLLGPALATRLCDVGGGQGIVVAAWLAQYRSATAALFDQPHVIKRARAYLQHCGVLDRATLIEGDFFSNIPTGHDCYLLRNILHDWDDVDALRLLQACRNAMPVGATLAVVENVTSHRRGFGEVFRRMDMVMMVGTSGGRQRDKAQLSALLRSAGFVVHRSVKLRSLNDAWLCRPQPVSTESNSHGSVKSCFA